MMKTVTFNSLLLSMLALSISTVGGSAITWKLADWTSATSFMYRSAIVSTIIFLFQILIYKKARKEIFFERIFVSSLSAILTWFFLSLSLPILWISSVNQELKWVLILTFCVTSVKNIIFGYNLLKRKWKTSGEAEFEIRYNQAENSIIWDKVVGAMKVEHEIVVPGVSRRFSPLLNFCLVGLMLLGLNLKNIFPVFSVIAWGVPTLIVASLFVQISSFNFFQACKIREIETTKKVIIKSGG